MEEKKVVGRECRHVVYCPPPQGHTADCHLVKEVVHFDDNTTDTNIRLIKDYKRPFWITRQAFRNHKQKKEWEKLEHVEKFECTQTNLVRTIAKAIGDPGFVGGIRKLHRNPYIYGSDILSTAVIKKSYQTKYPNLITPYTRAMFDVETDVNNGTEEIIMATLSFGTKVITAVQKSFVDGRSDVVNKLFAMLDKYLGDYVKQRNIKWEVVIVDKEIDCVTSCFNKAHEWRPDFVAIWNIAFDMKKILEACTRARVDPKDIFSDPQVPYAYRHFEFVEGPSQKKTENGKMTPIKPPARWHTVYCPSSFYFIDAMCVYKHVRIAEGEEPSYSLDNILQKHLGVRKLKFEEAEGMTGIDWHQFMQERYPLEYVIYNVFDCVGMELLDDTISDLSLTLPLFSGCSDFANFKSQPRRLADNLHYFALENGYVFGTTSDEMKDELDALTIGLEGWIITLPAHLVADNGLLCILENKHMRTNIRTHTADLDVAGSYPNGGSVFNISKETTHMELCKINGVTEEMRRMQGINLSGGATNAVEFACGMYHLPTMEKLLKTFREEITMS